MKKLFKKNEEFVQVIAAAGAVALLLLLKSWGVLVLNNLMTALFGGLAVYLTMSYVQNRQQIKQIDVPDESAHDEA